MPAMSNASPKSDAEVNPRTTTYEFFSPLVAFFITLTVPVIIYALYFGCSEAGCPPPLSSIPQHASVALTDPRWWGSLWDSDAAAIYFGWYAFCVVAWLLLPGEELEGLPTRTGERKKYKINALSTFTLALGITSARIYLHGPQSMTFIYKKWPALVTASLLMAYLQAFHVYTMSFRPGKLLALCGNTGNHVYDFFIGRELNPSIGSFDIKSFNELRPGLMLWVILDIGMLCEQAVRRGGLANVTDSMWLVLGFQTLYVADALWNEPALFTTRDITSDGFGFMLAVGDLAWVPFTYSLQARYLAFKHVDLGLPLAAAITVVQFVGFYIFRVSNNEKNDFKQGGNPKNLSYIATKTGSKLITSGWWGRCRHPNYLGDIILSLSWSLPTLFDTPITYFYPMYFTLLLIHRERRDDEYCLERYGEDWKRYKKLVPYRILPYVY